MIFSLKHQDFVIVIHVLGKKIDSQQGRSSSILILIFYSAFWCLKHFQDYTIHVMRKPVYAICEQQRCRSACASTPSYQHLCFRCLDSIIPLLAIAEISRPYLPSEAQQADLSLNWSETKKKGFLVTWLILCEPCQSTTWGPSKRSRNTTWLAEDGLSHVNSTRSREQIIIFFQGQKPW